MIRALLSALIIIAAVSSARAEVRVFLYPRYATNEKTVNLSEVAWVDGDADDAVKARRTEIPAKNFRDGFIDRSEITQALRARGLQEFRIIGSAVRIVPVDTTGEELEKLAQHAVKKGDAVKLYVRSGKILLETHGIASADAVPGDEIAIELGSAKNRKKIVKGIVREEHTVEVKL
ncbi:MAG TPA: flagella basal body P-ring formation protein FlgA [Spirochaetota bacterium]|nr:flagella basal body P-ring formation protein FlgA [Spirochaetota bacterium]